MKKECQTGQFVPGHSGNAAGRPIGAKGKKAVLEKILFETHTMKQDGVPTKVTTLDLVIQAIKRNVVKGNPQDIALYESLTDYLSGTQGTRKVGLLLAPEPIENLEEWIIEAKKVKANLPRYNEDDDD